MSSKPISENFVETNRQFHSFINNNKRSDNNEKKGRKEIEVIELKERLAEQKKEIVKMMAKLQNLEALRADFNHYKEK